MTQSTSTTTSTALGQQASPPALQTSQGNTTIADGAVQKIAGLAARGVSGVYASAAVRRVPSALSASASRAPSGPPARGVGGGRREAGRRRLDIVTEYDAPIAGISRSVRRNVVNAVEGMPGLQVTVVDIAVNDIHLPTDDEGQQEPARVQ